MTICDLCAAVVDPLRPMECSAEQWARYKACGDDMLSWHEFYICPIPEHNRKFYEMVVRLKRRRPVLN